jgi:hypothetical protein
MRCEDTSGHRVSASCQQEERPLPTTWGASTGAKTEEGRARISAANLRHGKFTKDKLEKRRENAAKGREIRKELRQMERELIAGGLLDKHWRDSFLS